MIYFVDVQLKDIFDQGKDFPWQRPEKCPNLGCNNYKVHGHGFAPRYFKGFPSFLYLKCYRCSECGCVITLRPNTHFPRIQSSKEEIRFHLAQRLSEGRWPFSSLSRSSLRYWMVNLTRKTAALLKGAWKDGLLAAYDHLLALGKSPISRPI